MMKKLTLLIVLFLGTIPVMAQSSFHAGYLDTRLQSKDHESFNCRAHGMFMGWTYRMKAQPDIPLYIMIGADFDWSWIKDKDDYRYGTTEKYFDMLEAEGITYKPYDVRKINYGGIKIPFNFAYEIRLSKKTPLYLIPQMGVHVYYHFSAREKENFSAYYKDAQTGDEYSYAENNSYNLIGNTDLGVYSFHRIVAGWQLGCSVRYGHYLLGGTFEQELMHLTNYGHTTTFSIKLGYEL